MKRKSVRLNSIPHASISTDLIAPKIVQECDPREWLSGIMKTWKMGLDGSHLI